MKLKLRLFLILLFTTLISSFPILVWSGQPGSPPTTLNHGGPDATGYTWIDNHDETGGPVFNWIDIAAPANNTHLNGGAYIYSTSSLPLGISFPFYGGNRTICYPYIGGKLLFISPVSLTQWSIFPLNDNSLVVDSTVNGEGVYKWSNNTDTTIVQWNAHYSPERTPARFELILLASGDFVIQYQQAVTVNPNGGLITVTHGPAVSLGLFEAAEVALQTTIHVYYPGNNSVSNHEPLPQNYSLSVYPNPFNSTANISISTSTSGFVSLNLYNAAGQFVRTIYRGQQNAGIQSYQLNANGFASGNYYLRVDGEVASKSLPVIYLK